MGDSSQTNPNVAHTHTPLQLLGTREAIRFAKRFARPASDQSCRSAPSSRRDLSRSPARTGRPGALGALVAGNKRCKSALGDAKGKKPPAFGVPLGDANGKTCANTAKHGPGHRALGAWPPKALQNTRERTFCSVVSFATGEGFVRAGKALFALRRGGASDVRRR